MIKHKHKGARNELAAVCWLLDQGYEVFRNVSQHGAIDIIAIRGIEILSIDVKAYNARPSVEQLEREVQWLIPTEGGFEMVAPMTKPHFGKCANCSSDLPFGGRNKRFCSRSCKNERNNRLYREEKERVG